MKSIVVLALVLVPLARGSASTAPQLVAFLNGTGVVVSGPDGSAAIPLPDSSTAAEPAWSPDGSRIAYVSPPSPNQEIVVANADGTGVDPLTSTAPLDLAGPFSPSWSPDGSEIAFLRRNAGPNESADVWVVSVATGALRQVTFDGGQKRGLRWQPHGSLILYNAASSDAGWHLWTVDAASGARRIVGDSPGLYLCAAWSPDGSEIAFCDEHQQLGVVNADGTGSRQLATNLQGAPPAWSPDGTEIATAETRVVAGPSSRYGPPTNTDVEVIDVASGQARRLTGWSDPNVLHPYSDDPSWWPDGSRIFYLGPGNTRSEMNADGSCQHPAPGILGTTTGNVWWQPGQPAQAGPVGCVDLRLRVTTERFALALGEQAGSTITIENDGNQPAAGVGIEISPLAPAIGYFFCPDGTSVNGCSLSDIAPGATRIVQAVVGRSTAGNINATVTIRSDEPNLVPADATTTVLEQVLDCTIVGTPGADVIDGTRGNDRICGLTGADRISGGPGNDYLDGGNGNDTIFGGPGHDTILGRGGRDVIFARDGQRDWIDCGTEYDIAVVDRYDRVRNCEKVLRG